MHITDPPLSPFSLIIVYQGPPPYPSTHPPQPKLIDTYPGPSSLIIAYHGPPSSPIYLSTPAYTDRHLSRAIQPDYCISQTSLLCPSTYPHQPTLINIYLGPSSIIAVYHRSPYSPIYISTPAYTKLLLFRPIQPNHCLSWTPLSPIYLYTPAYTDRHLSRVIQPDYFILETSLLTNLPIHTSLDRSTPI